ncbi:sn-glycerol-3-phosphate ABC transporter substrate-binding protein UgpB [Cupriavidus pauculus]|uniref:sn-glycerol-3-phosphate-binding periplasmic protein UgpB n=1 Tax=Cupriavidus pauculus TaxID=82633 RepID=A0A2N5C536_9BURK|nr:sn-glycerol-3-phosphate ABC transporter substrate-binding protein UgpB [Cupriavidus pauculus]PLP97333.1 sn-glycerol-3-phosphate ABC transporter substrate-binding protein UgpB [Cupriavidus pauculus]
MSFPRFALKFAAVASLALAGTAHAAVEIQWWHAMQGALNDKVNEIANKFNASQSDYKIVPVNKGNYDETMAAGIAAFRAGGSPAILQVFEVGTATMMSAKGAIKPVSVVMKEAGEKFDQKAYIPAVAGYYTSSKGEMLSFPFNSSTTVFYYNKDAFKKAGLSAPPKTWPEVMQYSAKLKAAGTSCGYTTDWQSWVHLESFSAWHNTLFASKNNGFGGTDARLVFNSPLHVKHITNLQEMVKKGYFSYGGRKSESQAKFYNGECAMFTGSSASLANIRKNAKFQFGVSQLPYYADVQGAPQNTIIGGASLWVMGGKKAEEYKGVAKFFTFLSQPEIQSDWHQATGYLPVTMAAYELTKKSGYYDKNPGADVSVEQMIVKTTDKSRGVRLGNLVQIRTIIDEELESVWAGKKEPKAALDAAVARGNEQLERFQKTAKE